MITTTLNKIREHSPCKESWITLNKELGSDYGGDTELKFSQLIDILDLDDALWCLRSICPEHDKEVRLFAADCAERVLHIYEKKYPKDTRMRDCINTARLFANGEATQEQLAAARAAARAAAGAAAGAARAAAWAAAGAAARAAAWAAARAVARAARDAEQKYQEELLIKTFG